MDRTLWDFDGSTRLAFEDIYRKYNLAGKGIASVDDFHRYYTIHNNELWARYRVGDIKKEELRGLRFHMTLKDFGIEDPDLAGRIGEDYLSLISHKVSLFPNAFRVLEYLKPKYKLHLITNGFNEVQSTKLAVSGLGKYFLEVITSEEAGFKKPDERIFIYALQKAGASSSESLMIGDDPEVDIEGAKNIGMDQVLFDPDRKYEETNSTYCIRDLWELKELL
ncbi:MAG: noncanonical pyrimidine nucleotidase, YjjG family [Chlorobi bacterium]|nr:noncanonical pyrimidine nucleotidase, YjjG family [Chlorobiota bacterium]